VISKAVSKFIAILEEDEKFPVTRMGLRYINHCSLNDQIRQSFNDYYNIPITELVGSLSTMSDFYLRVVEDKEDKYGLITQLAFLKIENGGSKYLIDLDAFKLEDINLDIDLVEILNKLHNTVKQSFSKYIKERYAKDIMEERD
jgi:uncharacterized protein (TIGR04255 family)